MGQRGEVFSWRVPSANEGRTYFLNVKENRLGDLYLTIVESKKHGETDFERHQVMFFEEDLAELQRGMEKVFAFIKGREGASGSTSRRPSRAADRGEDQQRRGRS